MALEVLTVPVLRSETMRLTPMIGLPVLELVIIPLNPKKGYDKPIVCTDIDKYFKMFLSDRDAFRKLYNL